MANEINVTAGSKSIEVNISKDLSAYYSQLSKDWATKTNGPVDNIEYSAKYYAELSKNNSDIGLQNIETTVNESITKIKLQEEESVELITNSITPAIENLETISHVSSNIDEIKYVAENVDDILNKNIEIRNTITSEPGTAAEVVNVGTKYNVVLDFTIPKGEVGKDGGMTAEYVEDDKTIYFANESGSFLYPKWGDITGDITAQEDLKKVLEESTGGAWVSMSDLLREGISDSG